MPAAVAVAALILSGCGTFANLSIGARQGWKNAQIYGGVRRDVASATDWVQHSWTWGDQFDLQRDVGTVVGVGLVGIDVPLSAIGDTLTLPVTIPAAIWGGTSGRRNGNRDAAAAPAPAPQPAAATNPLPSSSPYNATANTSSQR